VAIASSWPRRIFALLAMNSFLHLILDALEVKWGNEVYLFAPFSWFSFTEGLVWPEGVPVVLLTVWGIIYFLVVWRRNPGTPVELLPNLGQRGVAAVVVLAIYVVSPFFFTSAAEEANCHYMRVLRRRSERVGSHVEFDRVPFTQQGGVGILQSFTGEELTVTNTGDLSSGTVSIRGEFTDAGVVHARETHQHLRWLRDGPSLLGLFLIAIVWLEWFGGRIRGKRGTEVTPAPGDRRI
jgi:hypothetical protein